MLHLVVSIVSIIFLGPTTVRSLADYEPPYGERLHPRPFNYQYGVEGVQGGNYYKKETQDVNGNVLGEVVVNLPDGRVQKTNYNADYKDGYVADVKYTGEAKYPDEPYQKAPFVPIHLKQQPRPIHSRPVQHSIQHSVRPIPQHPVRPVHHAVHRPIRPVHHSVQRPIRPVHHNIRPVTPVHHIPQPRRPAHRPLHRATYRPRQQPELKSVDIDLPHTETKDLQQGFFEFTRVEEETTLPAAVLPVKDKERLVIQEDMMNDFIKKIRNDNRQQQVVPAPDQFEGENFRISEAEDDVLIPPTMTKFVQMGPSDFEVQSEAQNTFDDLKKIQELKPFPVTSKKQPEENIVMTMFPKTSEKLVKEPSPFMSIKSHVIEEPEETVLPVMTFNSQVIESGDDTSNSFISLGSSEESTEPFMSIKSHVIETQNEPIVPFMSIKSHVLESTEEPTDFISIHTDADESQENNIVPFTNIESNEHEEETRASFMNINSHVVESNVDPIVPFMSIKSHVIESTDATTNSIINLGSNLVGSDEETVVPFMSIKSHVIESPDETTNSIINLGSNVIDTNEQPIVPFMSIKSHVIESPEDSMESFIQLGSDEKESTEESTDHIMSIKSHVINNVDDFQTVVPTFESLVIDESVTDETENKQINIENEKNLLNFMEKIKEMQNEDEAKSQDIMSVKSRIIQQTSQDSEGNELMKISSRVVPQEENVEEEN